MIFVRLIAFFGFVILGNQITNKQRRLKRNGITVSSEISILKKYLTKIVLAGFYLYFLFEIVVQTLQFPYTILPEAFYKTLHHSYIIQIFGGIIIILSLLAMHFTLSAFNNSLRFGLNPNNLGELITTGIFSYTRNPFFVSIELYFLGVALIFTSPFFIVIALSTIISIHLFILKEEKFLVKNFGKEYENYAKNVRRYF